MYALIFYVPESHLEKVKHALFEKGAGRYDKYDRCAWQVKGTGQYRPLEGSKPFLGAQGKLHQEPEYRVEMVVSEELAKPVLEELIRVHPYEEPAYQVWKFRKATDLR